MGLDLSAYFKRIGFKGEIFADLSTLKTLHQLHTHAIPFENITPFTHQEVLLDVPSLERKMVQNGRGGYCFEQNILFSEVLKAMGYKVKWLSARVLWNQPEDLITRRSHMLFLVELSEGTYLADVGFGGMTLTNPIKFETDSVQQTTHEDFRIMGMDQDYKLQANVAGEWKTVYRFDLQEQFWIDYEVANFYLYTNHTSIFRNTFIAAKPFSEGRYALSNFQFTTHWRNGKSEKIQLTTVEDVKSVLREKFGIRLPEGNELDLRLKSLQQIS